MDPDLVRLGPTASAALPALLVGFVAAALVTLVITPFARRVARRLDVMDRPEARRVNLEPVPRGGGFAVAASFVPVSLALLAANGLLGRHFVEQPAAIGSPQLLALFGGGVVAVLIGALDDYFQLRARWQFLGQFVVAAIAVALGVLVTTFNDPFSAGGTTHLTGMIAVGVTAFWIVGMINSINFIDGLDGLSSGIALIAALTLGGISLSQEVGQPLVALLCFVLAGSLAGFLRWNFHPASIFAGTSGTMFLGYTLAILSILGTAKVAVALLVLGVPIIDAFWIIVRRLASGRTPFSPDRGHIHHRLLDLGLSHRGTVLLIYVICIGLAGLSFRLSGTGLLYAFLGLVVISGLALLLIARLGTGDGVPDELQAASYDPEPGSEPSAASPSAASPSVASPSADRPTPLGGDTAELPKRTPGGDVEGRRGARASAAVDPRPPSKR